MWCGCWWSRQELEKQKAKAEADKKAQVGREGVFFFTPFIRWVGDLCCLLCLSVAVVGVGAPACLPAL